MMKDQNVVNGEVIYAFALQSLTTTSVSVGCAYLGLLSYQRPEQIDPQVLTRTYFSPFKLFLHFPSRIVLIQRGKTGSTFWHIKVKESI